MGVNMRSYIGIGQMFSYDIKNQFEDDEDEFYDRFEDYMISNYGGPTDSQKELGIITDGMNGRYIFVGKIVDFTDEYSGFDNINKLKNLSDEERTDIEFKISELFDNKVEVMFSEIGYHVFTHYS